MAAQLRSVAVQPKGACLQDNVPWPEHIERKYITAQLCEWPARASAPYDVPVVGGAGLVATDLVVTEAWSGCPHKREPAVTGTPCYLSICATSGKLFGVPFEAPDGVYIEIDSRRDYLAVTYGAPPEGQRICFCGGGRERPA